MGKNRRRSPSSSSSSSSSSDEGHSRKHSKKHDKHDKHSKEDKNHAAHALSSAAGTPYNAAVGVGVPPHPHTDYRSFQAPLHAPLPPTMSGSEYSYNNYGSGGPPSYNYGSGGGDHGSFAPPSGPPPNFPSHDAPPSFPSHDATPGFPSHETGPGFPSHDAAPGFPSHDRDLQSPQSFSASPPPAQQRPPPSGTRIPLTTQQAFPLNEARQPPAFDLDGSPVFVGSALLGSSVHPCKIAPHLSPPCRVPYGGTEYEHNGRYDLLPFDPALMEWVPTSNGRIPDGRRPVEGGYEEHGGKLYHALANVNGVEVPGKAGEHLGGANVPFGGGEHVIRDNYRVLCWKYF